MKTFGHFDRGARAREKNHNLVHYVMDCEFDNELGEKQLWDNAKRIEKSNDNEKNETTRNNFFFIYRFDWGKK